VEKRLTGSGPRRLADAHGRTAWPAADGVTAAAEGLPDGRRRSGDKQQYISNCARSAPHFLPVTPTSVMLERTSVPC